LSNIGNTDRRHILESILQPSANVAPHYVAWHLEFANGKVKSGMLIDTNLDEYTYLDANGDRFKVKTSDLVEQRPTATSLMPEGLIDTMTDQELRDLLAYLQARK
jgi:putative heme-binding domain-containing protein